MSSPPRRPRTQGFTLIEMLLVLALLAILMSFGLPALQHYIYRGKIEGFARETSSLMALARLESVKRSVPARVEADYDLQEVRAYSDMNANGVLDGTDGVLGRYKLPKGVSFWGAPDASAQGANAIWSFDKVTTPYNGGWMAFNSDGSANKTGAFRFGDNRGNYLEVLVANPGTGRLELRKWNPITSVWDAQGDNGQAWTFY
jgi:prepilin-type N-terminal cleavage/methylation domain-containing protein